MRILFFLIPVCLFSQKTIYVNHASVGQNNGMTWSNAYVNLQDALAESEYGDSIWIAKGEYKPTQNTNQGINFEQKNGTYLIGGFEGWESSINDAMPTQNQTILSGNIGIESDSTDNSYTILTLHCADSNTVINGLTFRHGYAYSDTFTLSIFPERSGGAVYISADSCISAPKFINCNFEHNYAFGSGGAIYYAPLNKLESYPYFESCVFENNTCRNNGGGISFNGGGGDGYNLQFTDVLFSNNKANQGGAVNWYNTAGRSKLFLNNCTFEKNRATEKAACLNISTQGQSNVIVAIDSSLFTENKSTSAVILKYLSFGFFSDDKLSVYSSVFEKNIETYPEVNVDGSGLIGWIGLNSNVIVSNNEFIENQMGHFLFSEHSTLLFEKNKFVSNLYPFANQELDVRFSTNELKIKNNWFENNVIVDGRPALLNQVEFSQNSLIGSDFYFEAESYNIVLDNNIFFETKFNEKQINLEFDTLKNAIYRNNVFYNTTNINNGAPALPTLFAHSGTIDYNYSQIPCATNSTYMTCGANNIVSHDPMFLDTTANNFRLHPCSPLINAGTNQPIQDLSIDTDLDGNPRIVDGTVDIGPYESSYALGTMGTPQITAACYGLAEGTVHIAADGGCPPYAIDWTRSNDGSTGSDTSMLLAGDYIFTITDARGRSLELPLSIDGSSPDLSLSGDSTACAFIANGYIDSDIMNAEQPIDYQWNTGDTTPNIQNLQQGIYSLSITDAYGCKDTASLEVTATPPVIAAVDIQDATGAMNADGAIHFEVSSGFAPYDYLWSTGATTDSISDLLPGNYRVTVEDANGCAYVFVYDVSWSVSAAQPTVSAQSNRVFPNPIQANQPISLQFSTADRWWLMDASGRILVDLALGKSSISTKTLQLELPCRTSGVYFWAFYEKEKIRETGRLVVQD